MTSTAKWLKVTKNNPCSVCHKPDWCLVSYDGSAAICARIENGHPVGDKGAGWLHQLNSPGLVETFLGKKINHRIVFRWHQYHAVTSSIIYCFQNCLYLMHTEITCKNGGFPVQIFRIWAIKRSETMGEPPL